MPVPVPCLNRQPAHPINKPVNNFKGKTIPTTFFAGPKRAPPLGVPSSFRTREEWNNSLPSWGRPQNRPYWDEDCIPAQPHLTTQVFSQGLTVAENASVIKGAPAEACIPPMYHLLPVSQLAQGNIYSHGEYRMTGTIEDDTDTDFTTMDQAQFDSNMQWDVDFLVGDGDVVDAVRVDRQQCPADDRSVMEPMADSAADKHRSHSFGAFSPVYEDHSPATADSNTSPLEPITPFGEFVDRAVAEPPSRSFLDSQYETHNDIANYYDDNQSALDAYKPPPVFPSLCDLPKEPNPIVDTLTPSDSVGYKKLSKPLSEWVANYVWKVCTTGFSLPQSFTVAS